MDINEVLQILDEACKEVKSNGTGTLTFTMSQEFLEECFDIVRQARALGVNQ